MTIHLFIFFVALALLVTVWVAHGASPRIIIRGLTGGLLALNGALALIAFIAAAGLWLGAAPTAAAAQPDFAPEAVQAGPQQQQDGQQQGSQFNNPALGAALATGLAAIGAGIAVGISGAAAIGAITEKPEVLGRTLIFVGLAEGIAIYGLIIAFLILTGGLGGGGGGG